MIKAATAKAQQQMAAAEKKAEAKIAAEVKRSVAAKKDFEAKCEALIADVHKELKVLKAARSESAKEIDDVRRACERILTAHEANTTKIERATRQKIERVVATPMPISGILKQIAQMSREAAEEEL